jgi:protein-disulfide isomerase
MLFRALVLPSEAIQLDAGAAGGRIKQSHRNSDEDSMPISRRLTITALASLAMSRQAVAQTPDPRMGERAIGDANAKIVVQEWFSLTCSHCAEFQKDTFPQVKKDLIDSGKVRYVWHDYPLDQVALTAAMVARALPPERYEPFITTLLLTQDRWAFARGVNSTEELAKLAALAGMTRATFDATIADADLKKAILTIQDQAEQKLGINSTPSFIINGRLVAGAVGYPAFLQAVDNPAG